MVLGRGFDELNGEAHGVRKSLFNLPAAGQADIDVRSTDSIRCWIAAILALE
jgi:hypothetical protein